MNTTIKKDKYIFDPAARTITFVGLSNMFLQGIYAIFNETDGIQIYDFGTPALIGSLTGNVLTLTYDTTSMSATDNLLIKYDTGDILGLDLAMKVQDDSVPFLRRIVKLLEASANADIANRQRVVVEVLPTLATVTTVGTVTNLGNIASYDQRQWQDTARIVYNTGIRSKLTFV